MLSGIEAALWDLKGKLLNVPVYKLLASEIPGGTVDAHAKILAYDLPARQPPARLPAPYGCSLQGCRYGVCPGRKGGGAVYCMSMFQWV